MIERRIFASATFFAILVLLVMVFVGGLASAQEPTTGYVRPPSGPDAQKWGEPAQLPATVLPQYSDPKVWRDIRFGVVGSVSIPNKQAGQLIQSRGIDWVSLRNVGVRTWVDHHEERTASRDIAAQCILLRAEEGPRRTGNHQNVGVLGCVAPLGEQTDRGSRGRT